MFNINASTAFVSPAVITTPVRDDLFTWDNVRYFDNDGFQLSKLEQEYYKTAGIDLTYINGVWGAQSEWVESSDPNFIIDHSMIITRCKYEGAALEQINDHVGEFPYLKKYTKIRPKWGIDFALEYIDGDDFVEVVHMELDFDNISSARTIKGFYEHKIQSTDWHAFAEMILATKEQWMPLEGMKRNDWKAQKWGMASAENILKVV